MEMRRMLVMTLEIADDKIGTGMDIGSKGRWERYGVRSEFGGIWEEGGRREGLAVQV